ncbi:MAG: molecular chaperone TorD family protein [Anaerolineae bacterium]
MPSPRHNTYALLARLWLAEIDAPLADTLRGLPGFAEHTPPTADPDWLDEMAAEYARVLTQNVYPYESVFLGDDLMLNTDVTYRVEDLYNLAGFVPEGARVAAPDHLGVELLFMAHLIALEEDGRAPEPARRRQTRFLAEHLARWAPICALTVARLTPHLIYHALAQLTWELVLADTPLTPLPPLPFWERGGRQQTVENLSPPFPTEWGKGPGDEGRTAAEPESLGQVVRTLLTPARVGVFLCRGDMRRIGQALGLPTPLGDRFATLRALFEAAAQFDLLPALLDALDALWLDADAQIAALMAAAPTWSLYGREWRERLAAGQALMAKIREAHNSP